jgi:GTP-binding protein LepA
MGFGFRCGFLGMLHMEIVQERLEREYDLDLITTAPTVVYELLTTDGEIVPLDNPAKLPPIDQDRGSSRADHPRQHPHAARLRRQRDQAVRGKAWRADRDHQYLGSQVQIRYELPMAEVVLDFFDKLKSVSRGYASLDYHFVRFEAGPFVRLDVLINGDRVDALSIICHRSHADRRGREICEKMRN